ncbi:9346_t:CDS:2 [Diversispora eburnea]|uniref:9346_t:CDS:1 n=1 Tax=Diversispora eburnea TaxID=1213867 RepID=A0A9N8V2W3_9GLOM|nr:9346_t:CDS:2 [Diversispora eburnea]
MYLALDDPPNLANCGITDNINTIVDHGEASTHNFNDHEWFNDIIKNNGINKYDYDDFENLKYIKRGAFGSVHSATLIDEKMTKMKVALKSIESIVNDPDQ